MTASATDIRRDRAREWVDRSLREWWSESLGNVDAERAVIGSMLLEHRAIPAAQAVLCDGAAEFVGEREALVFEALKALYERSDHPPIDGLLIRQELQRRGTWEKAGGYDGLSGFVNAVASALRVTHYAQIVHDCYQRRRLVEIARSGMDCAMDRDYSAESAMSVLIGDLLQFAESTSPSEGMNLVDVLAQAFQEMSAAQDRKLLGQPSGFERLDEMTCGWQPGDLILIAARTSVGKTSFALQCATHLAVTMGRPTLFFSLEMSRHQLGLRIACALAAVPMWKLRRRRLDLHESAALERAREMAKPTLRIDDASSLRIDQLVARAHVEKERHQTCAIFVDYLQLLTGKPGKRYERREREIADLSAGLKALAKDLKVPVIAVCQLNRAPESRQDKRPRLSDLREGGTQEQDADVVILLHPEGGYETREEWTGPYNSGSVLAANMAMDCIVAKQRNGPTGFIKLDWNPEIMTFSERNV